MTSENPMMAFSGVRISWLILARKSDFADDARSAWRLALSNSPSVFFQNVMSRKMAQSPSPPSIADSVMNSGTRPPSRLRPMTSRPLRALVPGLLASLERFAHLALAFLREQACERQPGDLAADIAEQLFRAAIDGLHLRLGVEHDDAVGRGVEQFADFRAAPPWRGGAPSRNSSAGPRRRPVPRPVSISTSADSPSHGEENSRASTGTWSP